MRDTWLVHARGDQISYVQSMVAKRSLTNRANVYTPMWKKSSLKHSTAEFQSIQQFWLQLDIVSSQNKEKKHAFVSQFQKSYSDWIEKWMDRFLSLGHFFSSHGIKLNWTSMSLHIE